MDKRNEKVSTIIICILLSFGLWLYISNVENLNRSSEIKNVSVTVENESVLSESKLALLPGQNFQVNLRVEGPSKEVYSLSKEEFQLKVDLGAYALKSGVNTIPVKIVDYPKGINIKNTGNLTIKVVLENLEEKDISISSKIDTTFEEGISEVSSEISPQKVTISGPESLVDKVDKVILNGSAVSISKDFSKIFALKAIDANGDEVEGIEFSVEEATYSMKVKKQKEVPVKINYQGVLPNGISEVSKEQSLENITISGEVDDVDKIEAIETEPVYLSNITENKEIALKLVIPEGIEVISNDNSVTLTYVVEDNNELTKTIEGVEISYTDEDTSKYNYEYPTKTVDIQVKGIKADLENITKDNIKVTASVKELTTDGSINWNANFIETVNNVSIVNSTGSVDVKLTLKQ